MFIKEKIILLTGGKTADSLLCKANATAQKVNCWPNLVIEP